MLEHNDMYTVKQQLSYLVEYLQEYVEEYRQYENYKTHKLTPENVSIADIYRLCSPSFCIRMDDTQFRTKYLPRQRNPADRISISIELQRILKHCGFVLLDKSGECLCIPKSEKTYLNVNQIKHYIEKVIATPVEIMSTF